MAGYQKFYPSGIIEYPNPGYQAVSGAWGNSVQNDLYALKTLIFNVRDYGAAVDGVTDDTAACQAAINAAIAANGIVWFPGPCVVSTLTYKSNIILKGAGREVSSLKQKAATADFILKSQDNTTTQRNIVVEDLGFLPVGNTSSTGCILLEGTTFSHIRRCYFNQVRGAAIKLLGGAAQGDTMYNHVAENVIENLVGASDVGIRLSCQAAGGSHPDGTRIVGNTINSAAGTGILLDPPGVDSAGALGADNVQILLNCTIEVPTPLDICGQNIHVAFNRGEVTTGSMAVYVRAGTTNFPTKDVVFSANGWPTHASPGSFTFSDSGQRTVRWYDNDSGGTNYLINLFAGATGYSVRTNGDTGDRLNIRADGRIAFGTGTGNVDTYLYRPAGANAIVRTEGEINGLEGTTSTIFLSANVSGETGRRFKILASGELDIGPGDGTFDATLKRAASGVLSVTKLGVTNAAAATTPGAVVKKIEVFDGAGTSLGFIPVYSTIT